MNHSNWVGNHYNAGQQYGAQLRIHGINPIKHIPISQERKDFVRQSLPLYETYYPQILQEIRGMADGLGVDFLDVANFLLSMYCFVFDNKCSCFAYSRNGNVVFGRNSDFIVSIEQFCDSAFYQLEHAYSFIGNTTAWTQMEDGVNEYGLAVGLTFIHPIKIKPGFNAGMLVRCLLETCKSTNEAVKVLQTLPIGSPQTITLADPSGNLAVVECNCDKTVIIKPETDKPYVYTTNHFNSYEMQAYQYRGEDGSYSRLRYETLSHAFQTQPDGSLNFAKDLLSGKKGFLCQYDRQKGLDTVWSSIYDLADFKVYRAEGNPSRNSFELDARLTLRSFS